METKEKIERLSKEKFQELFGVKKAAFYLMLEVLERKNKEEHQKGGRTGKLTVMDRLEIMLHYYRDYVTMGRISFEYGIAASTVCDTIDWVEKTLIKYGKLPLPKKRKLKETDEILIDVTEVEIERPRKKQQEYYSGKKNGTR